MPRNTASFRPIDDAVNTTRSAITLVLTQRSTARIRSELRKGSRSCRRCYLLPSGPYWDCSGVSVGWTTAAMSSIRF